MKKQLLICLIAIVNGNVLFAQNFKLYDSLSLSKPIFELVNNEPVYDSFSIRFSRYDKNKRQLKRPIEDLKTVTFKVDQYAGDNKEKAPEYIPGSLALLKDPSGKPIIPSGITISILIVKSETTGALLVKSAEAIKNFIKQLPEGSVFTSWSHHTITTSRPYSSNLSEFSGVDITGSDADLYNAIRIKLHEFDKFLINENAILEPGYDKIPEIAERAAKDSINNYLIVLTDGIDNIDQIPKYRNIPLYRAIQENQLLEEIKSNRNKVKIFVLDCGSSHNETLKDICESSGNPGGYIGKDDPDQEKFWGNLINVLANDYQARFKNQFRVLIGEDLKLTLSILDSNKDTIASGSVTYSPGSSFRPVKPRGNDSMLKTLLTGLLAGVILLLLILILIQLIYPLIRNKIFQLKYVKHYRPLVNEKKRVCPYCFDEIRAREKVVVKCEHIVHNDCWVKGGYMCPEFGQNCHVGKQDYFDLKDPFSTKNKAYYLKWVLYGLIAGLLAWLIFILLSGAGLFDRLSANMVHWFYPVDIDIQDEQNFIGKISPSLITGMLMGFLLCCFFAYAEEYRRLSWPVTSRILLRGLIGSVIGFLSFFIGNLFILLFNEPDRSFFADSIPWLFFGAAIGYSLSVRTTIHWKHGLIGGLISVIFSFLVWYGMSHDLEGDIAIVICFMFYGAGLGFSIATVRSTAEQYFIKILNGAKEGNMIAVHKWMSSQGGMNEVFIGMSNNCEIQMNWEKEQFVGDKHAKMYINNTRKMPVMVSLKKDFPTLYDERIEMAAGKEYDLINGVTFKIGETIFQYIEKDNQFQQ
ncbi:MAG: hypothetical protein V1775_08260 [Bacteroidota bacterium]